jgi:hypothetical protein
LEPISNVDRIVQLLRQRLSERNRAKSEATTTRKGSGLTATQPSVTAALLAIDGVDPKVLRRSYIQSLLSEQLGENLVNDARFQQVVTRVADAIEEHGGSRALLDQQIAELRASG